MPAQDHLQKYGKIHAAWIIGVLAVLIIGLVSTDLGRVEGIKDILSFAVSFASLLLALIAIAQSALSGSGTAEVLGSVTTTAKQIEESSSRLISVTQGIPLAIAGIEASIVRPAQEILEAANKIDAYSATISASANDLRSSQEKMLTATSKVPEVKVASDENSSASYGGISNNDAYAYYIAKLSFMKGKEFNPDDLEMHRGQSSFIQGVLSAFELFGAIKYTRDKRILKVTKLNFNDQQKFRFEEALTTRTNSIFIQTKEKIDSYFGLVVQPESENVRPDPTT
ncbi:hypothetical protein [Methylobacterium sp. Leaf125]|uniref:hypothetical protein n=1 Tax=Methylobacterium sp. Leaf125 TaxID=1736265 RepID=UPI000B10E357|nr:hypothetical protein [Methylobacterium sp. Leaf125]